MDGSGWMEPIQHVDDDGDDEEDEVIHDHDHGGDGEKMILLLLMMVMNTWTTRVDGTSCTYDDDEGDIYRGVLEKIMIQMMRVMEMNTSHGRMGPVAHQLNRIAAHNVMHQIQMVLDRIICITSKQALLTPPPPPPPHKKIFCKKHNGIPFFGTLSFFSKKI